MSKKLWTISGQLDFFRRKLNNGQELHRKKIIFIDELVDPYLPHIYQSAILSKWVFCQYYIDYGVGSYIETITSKIKEKHSDVSSEYLEEYINYGKVLIYKKLLEAANPICINLFLTLEANAIHYGYSSRMLTANECKEKNIIPALFKRLHSNNAITELIEAIDEWKNNNDPIALQEKIHHLTSQQYLEYPNSYIYNSSVLGNSLKLIPDILSLVKIVYCHAAFLHCAAYSLMYDDRKNSQFLPITILINMLEAYDDVEKIAAKYEKLFNSPDYNIDNIRQMIKEANQELNHNKTALISSPKLSLPKADDSEEEIPSNSTSSDNDLLKLAVKRGKVKVVDCLMNEKDIDTKDALIIAVAMQNYPIIVRLVKSSKVADMEKYYGLIVAVYRGYTEAVKLLVINGELNVNVLDPTKTTLLKLATSKGYQEIVEFLVACGAKIRYHDEIEKLFYTNIIKNAYYKPPSDDIETSISTLYWTDKFDRIKYDGSNYKVNFNLALERFKVMCNKDENFRHNLCKKLPIIHNNQSVPKSFKDELSSLLASTYHSTFDNELSCLGDIKEAHEEI